MQSFEWANATSFESAAKLLVPDATNPRSDPDETPRPMGGGQDLLTTMKAYITRPPRVVNLKTIPAAGEITFDPNTLTIGALATLTQLANHPVVNAELAGLAEAAHSIATPQIRNLGTVGGNLCQRPRCWYFRLENVNCMKKGGDTCYAESGENKYNAILGGGPSYIVHPSDLSPMLVALGASIDVFDGKQTRSVPLEKFFTLPTKDNVRKENVLKDGEIIQRVHVPRTAGKSTYLKFKERESLDFAMSSVAAVATPGRVSLVLGGVAPIPWRCVKAEEFLAGKKLDEATISRAAELALDGAKPLAQNGYKIPLTKTLVRRALSKLAV